MKRNLWTALGATAAALVIACGSPAAPKTPAFSPAPPADIVPTTGAPATTPAAVTAAPATPAVPSITDGTWTVGEDIPAGTYKVTGAGSTCYWKIAKSGTNGSDIIDNHIGGGNLRVVLKAGQDFETARCGTWVKQ